MLVKVNDDSQIVIPKEIINKLNLQITDGDEVEILERNGAIHILPVVKYPEAYIRELEKEIEETKKSSESYSNIEDLIASLEE